VAPQEGAGELEDEIEDGIRVGGGLVCPAGHGASLSKVAPCSEASKLVEWKKAQPFQVRAGTKDYRKSRAAVDAIDRQILIAHPVCFIRCRWNQGEFFKKSRPTKIFTSGFCWPLFSNYSMDVLL